MAAMHSINLRLSGIDKRRKIDRF